MSKWWLFALSVVGVLGASAIFGFLMYRFGKTLERIRSDRKFSRRFYVGMALVYGISMFVAVSDVIRGEKPLWTLAFVPIPVFFIYVLLKAAQAKLPPG